MEVYKYSLIKIYDPIAARMMNADPGIYPAKQSESGIANATSGQDLTATPTCAITRYDIPIRVGVLEPLFVQAESLKIIQPEALLRAKEKQQKIRPDRAA